MKKLSAAVLVFSITFLIIDSAIAVTSLMQKINAGDDRINISGKDEDNDKYITKNSLKSIQASDYQDIYEHSSPQNYARHKIPVISKVTGMEKSIGVKKRSKRSNSLYDSSKSRYARIQNRHFINKIDDQALDLAKPAEIVNKPDVPSISQQKGQGNIQVYDTSLNYLEPSPSAVPETAFSSKIKTPELKSDSLIQHMKPQTLLGKDEDDGTCFPTFVSTHTVTKYVTVTESLLPNHISSAREMIRNKKSQLNESVNNLNELLEYGNYLTDLESENRITRRIYQPDLDLDLNNENDVESQMIESNQIPYNSPKILVEYLVKALHNFFNLTQTPNLLITSTPVLKYETIYESQVIPLSFGINVLKTTISKPVTTITKTEYELVTRTVTPLMQPFFPMNPALTQQLKVTSSPVIVTTHVTSSTSTVIKLTFGANVMLSTIYSNTIVPTVITSYVTSSVLLQPTILNYQQFPFP